LTFRLLLLLLPRWQLLLVPLPLLLPRF